MKFGLNEEVYNKIEKNSEWGNWYIMKRFEERKMYLINATNRLKEALEKEADDITIDGVLHRYEFTFELAWKTLKDYLEYLGISSNTGSPREVLKESYAHNLIENGEVWIKMMLARNSLSHLYDEEESRKFYEDIKNKYIFEIEKLVEFIEYK